MLQVMLDKTGFMTWFRFKLDTPCTYINWKCVRTVWCDFYNEIDDILKLCKQVDTCNEDTMRSVLDGRNF